MHIVSCVVSFDQVDPHNLWDDRKSKAYTTRNGFQLGVRAVKHCIDDRVIGGENSCRVNRRSCIDYFIPFVTCMYSLFIWNVVRKKAWLLRYGDSIEGNCALLIFKAEFIYFGTEKGSSELGILVLSVMAWTTRGIRSTTAPSLLWLFAQKRERLREREKIVRSNVRRCRISPMGVHSGIFVNTCKSNQEQRYTSLPYIIRIVK